MDFVDATLVRLADPSSQAGLFDDIALEQLVSAGYDTDAMSVEGPYQSIFDELQIGFPVPKLGTVKGTWAPVGGGEAIEARFRISGLGDDATIRVDAFWRGGIVARTVPATGEVTSVAVTWPDRGTIDAEIEADLGALPADAEVLEQERRNRFLARIQAALDQPAVFTDVNLDEWLNEVGATSVSDLLTRFQGTVHGGAVQVTFSDPGVVPPSPKRLPIAAAILIRDAGFSIAQLLMESKMIREWFDPLGLERPPDASLYQRESVLVVWMIPLTVFDDADWPGREEGMDADASRAARRIVAGQWLAREGIGLVTVTPPGA